MDIRINGKPTITSDENEELLNELVNRIVNEDVAFATGKADFDVESTDNDAFIYGTISINYKVDDPIIPGEMKRKYLRQPSLTACEDAPFITEEEMKDIFDIPRNKNQMEMFDSEGLK